MMSFVTLLLNLPIEFQADCRQIGDGKKNHSLFENNQIIQINCERWIL